MAVNKLGRLGRLSGIWLDMATRSQNQGMLGHPGAIRMILLHGESCNFSIILPNMLWLGDRVPVTERQLVVERCGK